MAGFMLYKQKQLWIVAKNNIVQLLCKLYS